MRGVWAVRWELIQPDVVLCCSFFSVSTHVALKEEDQMDPFFFSAGICHQERASQHGFARSTVSLIPLPRSNCSKWKSEEDCFSCLFFPSSPSPALSICWFCQSDLNSQHFQESLRGRNAPKAEEMPLEALSVPPPLPGGCCSCLECKTQQCFSSPPIWMGLSSSQGSCQRRQQPPGNPTPPFCFCRFRAL